MADDAVVEPEADEGARFFRSTQRQFYLRNPCDGPCARIGVDVHSMSPDTKRRFYLKHRCGMCPSPKKQRGRPTKRVGDAIISNAIKKNPGMDLSDSGADDPDVVTKKYLDTVAKKYLESAGTAAADVDDVPNSPSDDVKDGDADDIVDGDNVCGNYEDDPDGDDDDMAVVDDDSDVAAKSDAEFVGDDDSLFG